MNKQDFKFIKDYTIVLAHTYKNSTISIEDANDVLLSDRYYKQYRVEMVNTPDYKQAFLKYFEKEFNEKLEIAKNFIADKHKQKNKMKM